MTRASQSAPAIAATPLISVVIPVYRVPAALLRRCIESVLAQTLTEIEVILVDDGSPDECGLICDEFAQRDDRVVSIHKQNGGLSAARNTGQRVARSPRIMFVDGDDWIERDMCERLHDAAVRTGAQLVMCGVVKDYSSGRDIYRFNLDADTLYSGDQCRGLQVRLLQYEENIACAYAKLIDKSVLDEFCIEHDERLRQGAEGLEFNFRLFDHLQTALFIDRPLYHYVYNDESISTSHDEENHRYVLSCFEKLGALVEASDNSERLRPWFFNRLLYVVITTAVSGYFSPGNRVSFARKCCQYRQYLATPLVAEALASAAETTLSRSRRVILFFIKRRMFWAVACAGRLRYWQKQLR